MWSIRSKISRHCAWLAACLVVLAVEALAARAIAAAPANDHAGRVTFSGLPVPGATVTATHGETARATVTDEQGIYRFADLADGSWTIDVAMLGFAPHRQEIVVAADTPLPAFVLTLRSFDEIVAAQPVVRETVQAPAPPGTPQATRPAGDGFQRVGVTASSGSGSAGSGSAGSAPAGSPAGAAGARAPEPGAIAPAAESGGDRSADAADGFLINGSVNNGAASPFAQLPAFGNNRRGPRSLFNGGIGVLFGHSALDARPYSFTDQNAPKPSYFDAQVVGSFAGPVKLPGLRNKANLFLGFQHTTNHDATTQSTLMPTAAERRGDFSQSVNAFGQSVRIVDPSTGLPFAGNVIPTSRISPQAASLLGLYPLPNLDTAGQYNFQTAIVTKTTQDALQLRLMENLDNRNQVFSTISVQRTATDSGNIFGFVDSTAISGADVPVTWSHRFSQFMTLRLRYQFVLLNTHTTPYFSNRQNISGDAGILGNDQDPQNWGPPNLNFANGIAGLASAQYAATHDQTHGWGGEIQWGHGRHNITSGGDLRLHHVDLVSQQNARGSFTFTGASTGSALADFLLGIPQSSAIAFGDADTRLRATAADAYITDDWRLGPTLTANIGVRWEFEAPFSEARGRLANLDVAPGFTAVAPVVADNPVGALTGRRYPSSLLRPDFAGIQPRIGIAWRPVPGSSLVVRGGYGIYRNSSVYQTIDFLLAQQPPLAKTSSVENSALTPLTLANGFLSTPGAAANTFAVDPDLRVGFAHNWQLLVQRDLPASLTMTATYLGSMGRNLLQEFLPNTYPIGATNPCPTCPAGFVYLTSNGSATRNAMQLQLRRRLRNGLTSSVQYTLAKATDDAAAAVTGASLNGSAIAQDWQHLDAERAPSAFDQRHQVTAQVQYTSGVGVGGGTLVDSLRGSLLKGWTVTSQLTTGSGLPLTPVYLTSVPGTGVTGTIRPDLTGVATAARSGSGFYANPAAFVAPAAGRWGNAGRNSIRGPAQFSLNASLGRSFLLSDRLTLDWRIDATNVLNRVTYSTISTVLGSPQFGLPIQANVMRKLQSSLRLRF
jgi:hypothetical protein